MEIVQPCEQSLNSPAMPIPAQLAAILSSVPDAVTLMWCDHVDTLDLKLGIQPIAVVSAVANQSLRFGSDKALLKGSFDKGDLMRRSRRCVDGDRKTSAVCHCHELRTLAPLGLSHCAAPFLASTKVPSMKHRGKSSLFGTSRCCVECGRPWAAGWISLRPPLGSIEVAIATINDAARLWFRARWTQTIPHNRANACGVRNDQARRRQFLIATISLATLSLSAHCAN